MDSNTRRGSRKDGGIRPGLPSAQKIASNAQGRAKILLNDGRSHDQDATAHTSDDRIDTAETATPIATENLITGENDENGMRMILEAKQEVQDGSASTETALALETTRIDHTGAIALDLHPPRSDERDHAALRDHHPIAPGEAPPPEKQKPNFKPTGLLAKEANTVAGTTTVLKYNEPPEARKPSSKEQWRMYIFKGKDLIDTVYLYQRSVWLMGRDQRVTDLPIEHPSVSKQHAVIQFRYVTSTNEYGDRTSKVKPYLIDLESTKGTKLNGEKVEASRYVELRDQDVIGFGDSEREYVMMLPEK
ncbi:unnamed protein product [Zymoseptoria tritici ST99CH_3D7]|uniref:FHA domain-containing protein n=1 Tax=Zymoseptoria tritici (strain ST99CH_3D7) TaxID=1276538 RepID=A0A1X7S7Q3_ZYMT9|nr:unnamed protein product [Zymoseptoria tritici ST99CH_3D7]